MYFIPGLQFILQFHIIYLLGHDIITFAFRPVLIWSWILHPFAYMPHVHLISTHSSVVGSGLLVVI